jgi:perosamine synthetase
MNAPRPRTPQAALDEVLAGMPDPWATTQADQFERELAEHFSVHYAVAVSSGTAALHCALAALGIGPADEVLVPAMSVVMSAAPVLYTGATPVFVDSDEDGTGFDYDDLQAKLTARTRAVLPVYLWGRAGDPGRLREFAASHRLPVVEDACQAQGTRYAGQPLGTFGELGCVSTKDGKLLWSGEGGFVLTNDAELAGQCRAFRTHWQTPPAGQAPLSRLGHNYRLSEPQAAIARANLARFDQLLARRRHQSALLASLLAGLPGVRPHQPPPAEEWNGYAALARLDLPRPRQLSARLAGAGVPNSVGSYGLTGCDQRPAFAAYRSTPCRRAAGIIDSTLAVILTEKDDDDRIRSMAATITREVSQWTAA